MELPAAASVKEFEDARPGSLLIGRLKDSDPNFTAIRANIEDTKGVSRPCMVVLSAWVEGHRKPYISSPNMALTKVLDLGPEWSVDVSISKDAPTFTFNADTVLFRSGNGFFIHLEPTSRCLDLTKWTVVRRRPDDWNEASWSEFAVYLAQPGVDGPGAEVFRWTRPK